MSDDPIENLGALGALVGTFEGDKGADVAPSASRDTDTNAYRERMVFEPTGRVDNHEQILFGLRYRTTAWRIGADEPFHEEVGYWMWDAKREEVIRCFIVPRGITVIAGGNAKADDKKFHLEAEVGSDTFGILSAPFLNEEFRTEKYLLDITVHEDGALEYFEDTQIRIKGKDELFHHTDKNVLRRVD